VGRALQQVEATLCTLQGLSVVACGYSIVWLREPGPIFRFLVTEMPAPGSRPTCDTVGVLGPAVNIVASLETTEGLKILLGREDELHGQFVYVDACNATLERLQLGKSETPCPACDQGRFEFLDAKTGTYLTSLCGRNAVQINVRGEAKVSFPDLAERIDSVGEVAFNQHMLRFRVDSYELAIFPDGRAIIKGTTDQNVARSLYARYIGA